MLTKRKISLVVLLLILIGFLLRLKWLPDYLTFGFEQARDAVASKNIFLQKKLTLIGPTTEIEGIFHGPIYYYLIGIVYYFLGNNPAWVALLHVLINLSCIPIIFYIGKNLFNARVGLLAALIFTISFEVISYSLWLSNPSPSLPLIILSYYLFYQALKKDEKFLPGAIFLLSLSVSFDLIVVMTIFAFSAIYFVYRQKPFSLKIIFSSFLAFIIPLVNYPLFEIRHNFLMTRKFFQVFASQDSQFKNIFEYFSIFVKGLSKEFADVLFPVHGFFAGVLMLSIFFFLWQKVRQDRPAKNPWTFLLIWLFSSFPIFLIIAAVSNSEFSFFGVDAAIALLTGALIDELLLKKRYLIGSLIIFALLLGNLRAWYSYYPDPLRKLFDSQRGVILKDCLSAIDYTYEKAQGQPFFLDTVTVPLYVSPLWDFLYQWYGESKYSYLPSKDNQLTTQFLIIEPGWGQTYEIFKQKAIAELDKTTNLEEEKIFNLIRVEKRLKANTESQKEIKL